jgi:hypothetical protein
MATECGLRTERYFFPSRGFSDRQLTDLITFAGPAKNGSIRSQKWQDELETHTGNLDRNGSPVIDRASDSENREA